jgi:hypothetical protein
MRDQTNSGDGNASSGWNYLSLGPYSGESLKRHKERCHICRHPQREEIEEDFLDWTSPREIAETYGIASYRAIYRHATAVGLFDRRRANIQRATDRIIERVGDTQVTAGAIIAAIRITINEERKWLDYVHRLIHQDIRGEEMPATPPPDRLGRPVPPEYLVGLTPHEIEGLRQPQARRESRGDRPAAEKSARETAAAAPAYSPVASPARTSEQIEHPPEKSPAALAPEPAAPAEVKSVSRPCNAPGQVAGLPWPWPEKKIKFARRRGWRPAPPG